MDKLSDAMKAYNARQEELAASTLHGKPVKLYYDGASMDAIWGMSLWGLTPVTDEKYTYGKMAG